MFWRSMLHPGQIVYSVGSHLVVEIVLGMFHRRLTRGRQARLVKSWPDGHGLSEGNRETRRLFVTERRNQQSRATRVFLQAFRYME
jgi:hypothetical protein